MPSLGNIVQFDRSTSEIGLKRIAKSDLIVPNVLLSLFLKQKEESQPCHPFADTHVKKAKTTGGGGELAYVRKKKKRRKK